MNTVSFDTTLSDPLCSAKITIFEKNDGIVVVYKHEMSSLADLKLTEEQQDIVDTCCAPDESIVSLDESDGSIGPLVRITAAAGAGKTTTLLALAIQAIELGHTHISYVTFTNAAAQDGQRRIDEVLLNYHQQRQQQYTPITVEARTLHSFALRLLRDDQNERTTLMWTDIKVQKWINTECSTAIDKFLIPCYRQLDQQIRNQQRGRSRNMQSMLEERKAYALKKVQFFLYKSLRHFCQNSWTWHEYLGLPDSLPYEAYKDGDCFKRCKPDKNLKPFSRDYYPIKLFHQASSKKSQPGDNATSKANGEAYGFDPQHYAKNIEWYAIQVGGLWLKICQGDVHNFDFDMKRVQLEGKKIPGTMLLVDESQDMDGCQIDWAVKQQVSKFNTLTYVVGDPAQSIYGFRGAKPKFLLDLVSYHDFELTESWRFGTAISNIANLVLHCKEQSDPPQTTKKTWVPYRVRPGLVNKKSIVTMESLIPQWKTNKVTVIAFSNVKLLVQALDVLGFSLASVDSEDSYVDMDDTRNTTTSAQDSSSNDNDDNGSDSDMVYDHSLDEKVDNTTTSNKQDSDTTSNVPIHLPKIHINGNGENSGMNLWKKTLKLIDGVFQLFKSGKESDLKLDAKLFPDFIGRTVTWASFVNECEQRELQRYMNAIHVVKACKMKTPDAISTFQQHVLDQKYTAEEADIVLTTCHAAKGMEWDSVHVCDDFDDLCNFKRVEKGSFASSTLKNEWMFGFDSWADGLNLIYVACTRAKHRLHIPSNVSKLLSIFDDMYGMVQESESTIKRRNLIAYQIPGNKTPLNEKDVHTFTKSIIVPLRKEFALSDKDLLVKTLTAKGENSDNASEPDSQGIVPDVPVDAVVSSNIKTEKLSSSNIKTEKVRSAYIKPEKGSSSNIKPEKGSSSHAKANRIGSLNPQPGEVGSLNNTADNINSLYPKADSIISSKNATENVCILNTNKKENMCPAKRKRKTIVDPFATR